MTTADLRSDGVKLAEVVRILDEQYPQWMAEEWDAVGLVCGRADDPVSKVHFAVDPHPAVVAEALDWGADLIVTHHPLFLTPVHDVASGWKGAMVHDLIRGGVGLYSAHTNADVAANGVNDALAAALGLQEVTVLAKGAAVGRGLPDGTGLGRLGRLPTRISLGEFAAVVAQSLPAARGGIRVAGDFDVVVQTIAVCGGAGDSLIDTARAAGADVYVTADLRHHRTADGLCDGGPVLVDAGHWSTEWPWLPVAAERLVVALEETGTTVETRVSTVVTDPWSYHQAFE